MDDITEILVRIERGDRAALDELLPRVYETLKRIARRHMARENVHHTLQPTALVSEAYLRLVGANSPLQWQSRGQFYAAAAVAMRRILVDYARKRASRKRGGGQKRVPLDSIDAGQADAHELLELDEALSRLAHFDARKAKLVELRCFAGLDREELSNALGVSIATVDRDWLFAKAWLYRELGYAELTEPCSDSP